MITGRFWTIGDLCDKLGVSKPRITALANHYGWHSPHPGLYTGGSIEDKTTPDAYLAARARADIRGLHHPDWDGSKDLVCQRPGCNAIALQLNGQVRCAAGHGYLEPNTDFVFALPDKD